MLKSHRDGLLIIYFDIEAPIPKETIKILLMFGLIVQKHPRGWMTTSLGRSRLRELKIIR